MGKLTCDLSKTKCFCEYKFVSCRWGDNEIRPTDTLGLDMCMRELGYLTVVTELIDIHWWQRLSQGNTEHKIVRLLALLYGLGSCTLLLAHYWKSCSWSKQNAPANASISLFFFSNALLICSDEFQSSTKWVKHREGEIHVKVCSLIFLTLFKSREGMSCLTIRV